MIHFVDVIFQAVARPFAASVLVPVVALFTNCNVSLVIAMLMDPPPLFWKVSMVPSGNATDAFAGMVIVKPDALLTKPVLARASVIDGLLVPNVVIGAPG
jgi:hypothetical protein